MKYVTNFIFRKEIKKNIEKEKQVLSPYKRICYSFNLEQ